MFCVLIFCLLLLFSASGDKTTLNLTAATSSSDRSYIFIRPEYCVRHAFDTSTSPAPSSFIVGTIRNPCCRRRHRRRRHCFNSLSFESLVRFAIGIIVAPITLALSFESPTPLSSLLCPLMASSLYPRREWMISVKYAKMVNGEWHLMKGGNGGPSGGKDYFERFPPKKDDPKIKAERAAVRKEKYDPAVRKEKYNGTIMKRTR